MFGHRSICVGGQIGRLIGFAATVLLRIVALSQPVLACDFEPEVECGLFAPNSIRIYRYVEPDELADIQRGRRRGQGRVGPHFLGDLPVAVDSAPRRDTTLVGV